MAYASYATVLSSESDWEEQFGNADNQFPSLFNQNIHADATFIVGSNQIRIPGHKLLLGACSWLFYVAFFHLNVDNNEFPIPDASIESFMCLLEFCYKGDVNLGEHAWDVLQLAYRFKIKKLISKCENFVEEKLNPSTCLLLYAKDMKYGKDSPLAEKIFTMVKDNMNSNNYLSVIKHLSTEKLLRLAQSDDLNFNEIDLFNAVIPWARKQCREARLVDEPKNLRKVLSDIFYEIRFPIMKEDEFIGIIADYPGFLTMEETSRIIKFIRGNTEICPGFKHTARQFSTLKKYPETFVQNNIVHLCCSTGSIKMLKYNSFTCNNLSINFYSKKQEILIGFGYYVKRPFSISFSEIQLSLNSHTMYLECDSNRTSCIKYDNEYEYRVEYFKNEMKIKPIIWYTLICNCHKNDSKYVAVFKLKNYDNQYGITVRKYGSFVIPYLLFKQ